MQGSGMVLPEGAIEKIKLDGDTLHIAIIGLIPDENTVIVAYPDGYTRHHQAKTVIALLQKIEGQLRGRYNLTSFAFTSIPESLSTGTTITLGDINYA